MFSMYTASNGTEKNLMSSYRHSIEIAILLFMSFIGFKLVKRMVVSYRGLLSICCMVFLGFADDALDLPWRHKILLPSVASLPLLMVHLANEGTTRIVVPVMLRNSFGDSVDIGVLYYIYMGLLAVFCTNSINIYAGINGLEVGQGLVIAISVIVFNLVEIRGPLWRVHLFSLYFLIPFLFVCMALYKMNAFPAKVFVGDTFCYFAGMTLAVVGILGHFSKTLILFFIPQILNFLISLPQISILIPCPRHRLPQFSTTDSLLHPSCVRFHPKSLSRFGQILLKVFSTLRLVSCRNCPAYEAPDALKSEQNSAESSSLSSKDKGDSSIPKKSSPIPGKLLEEEVVEVTNFTLINTVLRITGPMSEANTTTVLILIQVLCSCLAFVIRYPMAWYFYEIRSR